MCKTLVLEAMRVLTVLQKDTEKMAVLLPRELLLDELKDL
jgi:hypothetical protein